MLSLVRSWSDSVNIVARLWAGLSGIDSWYGQGFLLFATMSRLVMGPTQPPIKWVPEGVFPQQ
jgi:hypothetical protein